MLKLRPRKQFGSSSRRTAALSEVLETIHRALRSTRGAAVAIAEIDPSRRRLQYVGIGNISGAILGRESTRNLVSHNGIVGHAIRRIQEFSYELPAGALTVLHSDGLKSRWSLDGYPGLPHATRPSSPAYCSVTSNAVATMQRPSSHGHEPDDHHGSGQPRARCRARTTARAPDASQLGLDGRIRCVSRPPSGACPQRIPIRRRG